MDVSHSSKKLKIENVFSKTGVPKPINIVHTEKVKETNFSNTFSSKKQACFEVREKDVNSVNMKPESENVSEPLLSDISGFNKFDMKAKVNIEKFHKSMKYSVFQCQICFEAWPIITKPKSDFYFCKTCDRDNT